MNYSKEIYNGLIIACIIGVFTWAWNIQGRLSSLESQQNIVKRVENIENLIFPLVVDYKTRHPESNVKYYNGGYETDDSDGFPVLGAILGYTSEMSLSPDPDVVLDEKIEESAKEEVFRYRP